MVFENRQDAGIKLAAELKEYERDSESVIVAIPRGGVEVAFFISQKLSLPMEITIARKIGSPFSSELAVGAVSEEGDIILNDSVIEDYNISREYINLQAKKEREEIKRRLDKYRGGKKLSDFRGKKVIITDDGIATGATIKAIIKLIKKKNVQELVVAVPVAALDTLEEIRKECDKIVCLYSPSSFGAVGAFYRDFDQVSDEKVLDFMKKHEQTN